MDASKFITRQEQINQLLCRRFDLPMDSRRGLAKLMLDEGPGVATYKAELDALPDDALWERYSKERDAERQEQAGRRALEESRLPFNLPAARNPDFGYWGKADVWTLDEGIALLLARTPAAATWEIVNAYTNVSPFAKQFAELRDLAMRSVSINQLAKSNYPPYFLQWARKKELPIPEKLESEVSKHSGDTLDWRELYGNLKTASDEHRAQDAAARAALVDTAKQQIDKLQSELQQARNETEAIKQERDQLAAAADQSARCSYDPDDPKWPEELDIAMTAWRAAWHNAEREGRRPGAYLREWVQEHYPERSSASVDRIATIADWDKSPGPVKG